MGIPEINFEDRLIESVPAYNYLGVKLDQVLNYELHAKTVIQKGFGQANLFEKNKKIYKHESGPKYLQKHDPAYTRLRQVSHEEKTPDITEQGT